jgi:hypothetical protein
VISSKELHVLGRFQMWRADSHEAEVSRELVTSPALGSHSRHVLESTEPDDRRT